MQTPDYYKTLGLSRTASGEEIKKAYRKLAREFHPDRNTAKDAEQRFKEINEANEVLSDPEKRRRYDTLGPNWRGNMPPPGWESAYRDARSGGFGQGFGSDANGFSDFFSSLFGGAPDPRTANVGRPRSTRQSIRLALEDSYQGAQQRIMVGGRALEVRIPRGVTAGQSIRVSGQGPGGGDLLLEVQFAAHPLFTADNRTIHHTATVAPWLAALGGSLEVPTLGGQVTLTVAPGSQPGSKLRLKGRGLPGKPPGDQIVTLAIAAPKPVNDAQREAYVALRRSFDN